MHMYPCSDKMLLGSSAEFHANRLKMRKLFSNANEYYWVGVLYSRNPLKEHRFLQM